MQTLATLLISTNEVPATVIGKFSRFTDSDTRLSPARPPAAAETVRLGGWVRAWSVVKLGVPSTREVSMYECVVGAEEVGWG